MNGMSMGAAAPSNVPWVHCHPNEAVAAAIAAKIANSSRCVVERRHSNKAPNAAIWTAVSAAKIPAARDACTSASMGRIITYSRAVSEAVIKKTSTPISRRSRTSKCSRYSALARPTIGIRNSAKARSLGPGT